MTAMIRHHTNIAHARATTRKPVFSASAPHILPSWYEDEYAKAWAKMAESEGHAKRIPINTSAGEKADVAERRARTLASVRSKPGTSVQIHRRLGGPVHFIRNDLYKLEAAGLVVKSKHQAPIWSIAGEAGQ